MPDVAQAIRQTRDSLCAIMRIIKRTKQQGKRKPATTEFRLAFVGTGWCISIDRYLVTAHHVLNNGKPRDSNDLFYAFTVPDNGPAAYQFPVVGFPFEDPVNDLAILELGPPADASQHITAIPVTFTRPDDGTSVLTYGFPSPEIRGANLAPDGRFLGGGQFFLKGHANEGILAAQYQLDGAWHFEFNVGWHHGESGGPVLLTEPVAVFAVMQHYRNIQTPHGVFPGPHRGRSIDVIQEQLLAHGATVLSGRTAGSIGNT